MAIEDINPKADTHLLVLPERHIDGFREIAQFPPDEAKRMLDFVAETAEKSPMSRKVSMWCSGMTSRWTSAFGLMSSIATRPGARLTSVDGSSPR